MSPDKYRRDQLTPRITQQKIVYEQLLEGLYAIRAILPTFDNKVVNLRILSAIKDNYENPCKLSFSINAPQFKISNDIHRKYTISPGRTSYVNSSSCQFPYILKNENRLDAHATLESLENAINIMLRDINECQIALDTMDDEFAEWLEIKKKVEAYDKTYSCYIKGEIDMKR